MAKTLSTTYIDDLDGSEMTAAEATTVSWSWRGVDYEFDTRAQHLSALEADEQSVTLRLLLASSRRVGGRRSSVRPVGGATVNDDASAAAIRAWATRNGILVPTRGRIPQTIRDAYNRSHNSDIHGIQDGDSADAAGAQSKRRAVGGVRV